VRRVGSYFCYGVVLVLWSRSWISNIKIRPWIEYCSFYWKISETTTTTTAAAAAAAAAAATTTTTTTTIIVFTIIIKV